MGRLRLSFLLVGALLVGCKDKQSVDPKRLVRKNTNGPAVVVSDNVGVGERTPEREPNDTRETAQEIHLPGANGTLQSGTDVDTYWVSFPEDGYVFIEIDGAAEADLKLAFLDGDYKELASSDRGPAQTPEGIGGYPVSAGRYYIVVSEFTKRRDRKTGGRKGESKAYALRVRHLAEAEEGFEREPNETPELAGTVVVGTEVHGYLGWNKDRDLWQLSVLGFDDVPPSTGEEPTAGIEEPIADQATTLNIDLTVATKEVSLALLGEEGTVLTKQTGRDGKVGIHNFVPEVTMSAVWLEVSSKRPNPLEPYTLSVAEAKALDGAEREVNDSVEQATPILGDLSQLVVLTGEVSLGDLDHFAIPVDSTRRVLDLTVAGGTAPDLEVSVLVNGNAVATNVAPEDGTLSPGLAGIVIPAQANATLRIAAKEGNAVYPYRLSLTLVRAP